MLGALVVADLQVLEFWDVGKPLGGNAHRRAGLLQGGGELLRLLLASVRGASLRAIRSMALSRVNAPFL